MMRTQCRMCHSKELDCFLDLGFTPPSDAFLTQAQLNDLEVYFPLKVNLCAECGLAQLNYVIDGSVLYQRCYPYESSTTQTGGSHFDAMSDSLVKRFNLCGEDLVIDVGSNVGVLLSGFKKRGTRVLGVDPALDMAETANQNGIKTLPVFFNLITARQIKKDYGGIKLITGTNVFAHVDNLYEFMQAVDLLLEPRGVLVIEAPHFLELVRRLAYDTIYHEHLSYLAVRPMKLFFERFGFTIFDIEPYSIHGGSLRFYIARLGIYPVSGRIESCIQTEEKEGIFSLARLQIFAREVQESRYFLVDLLRQLKGEGKKVMAISAPAKGNTLLNYCHITADLVMCITEKAKIKIGLFTPGTHIPIRDDAYLLKERPDYGLILAWNFAEEIMANLTAFRKAGGKFIIPVPVPCVVE